MGSKAESPEKSLPVIAIVGRPNVGKSSLFNAVIGRRLSIVHEQSGVTRDRVIAPFVRQDRLFRLVDTGGLGNFDSAVRGIEVWDAGIEEQVEAAIADADVLIFVVNVQEGVTNLDKEVARRLHGTELPVIVVANKSDNPEKADEAAEFSELGFEEIVPVSCLHRSGVESAIASAIRRIDKSKLVAAEEETRKVLRIAVAGRPNVGKSSLVNALLGENRVIVSDIAGTTRDAIDVDFQIRSADGEQLRSAVLVDTAGLRRKGKVDTVVEYFSTMRTESAINGADLVLFLVEASVDGATAQDKRIAAMIEKSGKSCIIVANKCDLCDNDVKQKTMLDELRFSLHAMTYAPVVFISALERRNLGKLLDQIVESVELMAVKVPTSLLNKVLADSFAHHTPPVVGTSQLKLYYASMISATPPKFLLFVNNPKLCAPNYLAFLKSVLRESFDFTGMPIEVELRARPKKVESIHTVKPKTKPGRTDPRNSAARAAALRKTRKAGRKKSGGK